MSEPEWILTLGRYLPINDSGISESVTFQEHHRWLTWGDGGTTPPVPDQVVVTVAARDALVALGWTPPKDDE